MSNPTFTWIKTHQELAQYLLQYEHNQQALIDLLNSVGIGPLNDENPKGTTIPLDEIDPFTFYCYIHKYSAQRLSFLQKIAEKVGIHMPEDAHGIPSVNPQKVWLFPKKYDRKQNEIVRLWAFFKAALEEQITDEQFADVLAVKGVGQTKLTEVLFFIAPEKYFPIDGPTKPFLKEGLKINPKFKTWTDYKHIMDQIREKEDTSFYELSLNSWDWADAQGEPKYWVFQGNPSAFDIKTALEKEILEDWTVSSHIDKIKIGDKVILWVTGRSRGCYALAEVTSLPAEKNITKTQELWKREDKSSLKSKIKITHNLVKNPIAKAEINAIPGLAKLKIGNQGSNFSATQEEYELLLELAEQRTSTFYKILKTFDQKDISVYFRFLKEIIQTFSLKKSDPRLVFSLRGNRLNFIIGQRYCWNLYATNPQGKFRIISNEAISENTGSFDNTSPLAYLNSFNEVSFDTKQRQLIFSAIERELARTKKSGFRKSNDKAFENYTFDQLDMKQLPQINYPLNTIFYGPPGTGKTYQTIQRAAEIIEKQPITSHEEAQGIFNHELGNRIEFITFHQNYSYEDFIQGLRPDTEKGNQLTFEKRDGVFMQMTVKALFEYYKKARSSAQSSLAKELDLNEAFLDFVEELKKEETNEFPTITGSVIELSDFTINNNLEFKHQNSSRKYVVSGNRLTKLYEVFTEIEKIKNVKDDILGVIGGCNYTVYWAALKAFIGFLKDYKGSQDSSEDEKYEEVTYESQKKLLASASLEDLRQISTLDVPNYVIIIDEINRANISRVFGELITLIEPDKRSHGAIPLRCTLPSGEEFIVPSNLYLIGTMNTADKSIALLDIALRRRFQFEAMYPRYEIEGKEIFDVDMLKKINELIIKHKGHDFQIGHSYFMDKSIDLLQRMNNKVIPLLLEYFMNDEDQVKSILRDAGLKLIDKSWPIQISGKA